MDEQRADTPQEFDASAVNDLDTARLALRWALERLHKLGAELSQAREELSLATKGRDALAEEARKKDETVKRWRETLKVWEASMAGQHELEKRLREELRAEVAREQDAHVAEERLQLGREIEALKRGLADREAALGALRRELIDAVKAARL